MAHIEVNTYNKEDACIVNAAPTGCFVFDKTLLKENIKNINSVFAEKYPDFQLTYSIKANYYQGIIDTAITEGLWLEIASLYEYQIAMQAGVPRQIIVNCPCPDEELLQAAYDINALVNIDSIAQLERLAADNRPFRVGLRFSFPVEGSDFSRFGMDAGVQEIERIIDLLLRSNLKVEGVHCHFVTSMRSLASFEQRTSKLAELYKEFAKYFNIKYLNVGGGFFGPLPQEIAEQFGGSIPSFDAYSNAICNVLHESLHEYSNKPKLIIEPGAALVANCIIFRDEVLSIKKIKDRNYAIIKASINWLKPTRHSKDLHIKVHKKSRAEGFENCILVSNNCMEEDILGVCSTPLSVGDIIEFKNVGAYTYSFGNGFINGQPTIINSDEI
ncbi:hypothetical protein GC194_14365 [bacterium]|nr:hypothetical protein [bacterium]